MKPLETFAIAALLLAAGCDKEVPSRAELAGVYCTNSAERQQTLVLEADGSCQQIYRLKGEMVSDPCSWKLVESHGEKRIKFHSFIHAEYPSLGSGTYVEFLGYSYIDGFYIYNNPDSDLSYIKVGEGIGNEKNNAE